MKALFYWIINGLLTLIVKLVIIGLVISVIIWVGIWYLSNPASDLCDSLAPNDSLETLESRARQAGYRIFQVERNGNLIVTVPTQDSPFFRMACKVTFMDGVITEKSVVAAD